MKFKSAIDRQQLIDVLGNKITIHGFQKAVKLTEFSVPVRGQAKKSLVSKAALLTYDFKQCAVSTNELSPTAFDRLFEQRVNLKLHATTYNEKVDDFVKKVGVDTVLDARPIAALKLIVRATHLLPFLLPGTKERQYAPDVDWSPYYFQVLEFIEEMKSDLELIKKTLNINSQLSIFGLEELYSEIHRKCDTQFQHLQTRQAHYSAQNVVEMIKKVHPMSLQFLLRDVLAVMGHVEIRPQDGAGDNGIDLISYKTDEFGIRRRYIAQCKARVSKMGKSDVHQFALQCGENDAYGIYVSLGGFVKNAEDGMYLTQVDSDSSWNNKKIADVTLVDRGKLIEWVMEYGIGCTSDNTIDYQYWARMQAPLFGNRFA